MPSLRVTDSSTSHSWNGQSAAIAAGLKTSRANAVWMYSLPVGVGNNRASGFNPEACSASAASRRARSTSVKG